MTVKVYKKRVHWYYKFRCQEYSAECFDDYLNKLSELINTNVIYFKLKSSNNVGEHYIGRLINDSGRTYFLDTFPLTFLFNRNNYPKIILPIYTYYLLYVNLK